MQKISKQYFSLKKKKIGKEIEASFEIFILEYSGC